MMGTVTVELTREDEDEIERLAKRRGDAQRAGDTPADACPTTFIGFSNLQWMEYIGFAGEYAFAKQYGLETPAVSRVRLPEGDVGYDFVIYHTEHDREYRVDIKSTDKKHGNLLDREDHSIEADLYVLAVLQGSVVKLKGYATADELDDAPIKQNGMTFPCRYIPSYRLHDCFDPEHVEERPIDRTDATYSGARRTKSHERRRTRADS